MRRSRGNTGPVAGLAFVGFYIGFAFTPLMDLPEGRYSDERVLALLIDAGSRTGIVVGGVLVGLAGVAMLVFVTDLRRRLDARDHDGLLPALAYGAGLVYVVLLFAAGNAWTGYAAGLAVGELPAPDDANLVRVLSDAGFGLLLVYGMLAAAVFVGAAALSARRSHLVGRSVTTSGMVMAPMLLLGFTYMPQFLVPLWVLLVSIALLRRPTGAGAASSPRGVAIEA